MRTRLNPTMIGLLVALAMLLVVASQIGLNEGESSVGTTPQACVSNGDGEKLCGEDGLRYCDGLDEGAGDELLGDISPTLEAECAELRTSL